MSLEEQHGIDQSQSHMIDSDKVTYSDRDRKPHFNPRNYIPSALKTPDKNQPMTSVVDTNIYSIKKTAMTILCLLIIIMTNSVQLKVVTKLGSGVHPFYGTQVTLGVISILIILSIMNAEQKYTEKRFTHYIFYQDNLP
ncbi:unnamed protein product [Didymodactylos carnosus]|uniref:Uncharacterized protein n=1 Tax=Didymodactylos carnosus TaxID=1234261 RepID=A0A813QJB5_9BILA|nr:unnamed protein product [Didymodactylos carnosus]CAF3549555.1 unnamed protein product [Didymodactylos carnosus]